ncbi:C-type lectin 37Db-like [Topomyia yanbarensis]|uniref:C-type lectin 37Db-like n=1 Tax=Topomyia yanbarensis TaxID=2498891 RepID=UPI00273CB44D|nr:C-type lectin 37Db-like [Topomyia yanbarensis]XP_058837793.1 C-type lectin 37Db-like [Topomyia yanbarensis]
MTRSFLLMLGAFYALASGQQMQCFSMTRYYVPNFKANWFRATEHCFSFGMRIAIVPTPQDHNAVVEVIKQSEIFNNESTIIWLGASDLAQEGTYVWHATGARLQYANWHPGQPDNYQGNEHCLALMNIPGQGWKWNANDGPCVGEHYFVCDNAEAYKQVGVF